MARASKPTHKLVADRDYLPTLLELIMSARASIDIMAYSFAIGSGRNYGQGAPYEIAQALIELKKSRGQKLRIRLYIEGFRETEERNRVTAELLAQNGIEVVYGTTHAKGVCVDQKTVLFGSTNWTNQSIAKNPEANILMQDPVAAAQFVRYYEFYWNGGEHGGLHLEDPFLADGDFAPEIIAMIDAAKSKIEFAIYFFDQKDIEHALLRAFKRGVDVRGLIHRHKSFAMSYVRRGFATVRRLRAAGMEDLHFGIPSVFSHSKYIVIDEKDVALGTGNWLNEDIETHPQLYVHIRDGKIARSLQRHLNAHIQESEKLRELSSELT